jgi:glutamate/tyrosine decarboxylase-like PLP-dependent enzyme
MDLFITLLSLGRSGYRKLVAERKSVFQYLQEQLGKLASNHKERLLSTTHNPISLGTLIVFIFQFETTFICSVGKKACWCMGYQNYAEVSQVLLKFPPESSITVVVLHEHHAPAEYYICRIVINLVDIEMI